MQMTMFLVLCCLAIAFFFYVLVNFCKEATATKHDAQSYSSISIRTKPEVFVDTRSLHVESNRVSGRLKGRFPAGDVARQEMDRRIKKELGARPLTNGRRNGNN